jgi:hypothetical protein
MGEEETAGRIVASGGHGCGLPGGEECGDERTRTADPLLAKQVLYQLSYVPAFT